MDYGRTVIYTDELEITSQNVVDVVTKAYATHLNNRNMIDKLYNYYKGKTEILNKRKEIREDINHKINENRAYEIVNFHKGYVFGEPIQYVRRENSSKENDDKLAADINALNGYMSDVDKSACDNEIAEWLYVAGTSYRLVLPNIKADVDETPFKITALDPRHTFVIYANNVDKEPLCGVLFVEKENNERIFSVYTKNEYFEFKEGGKLEKHSSHALGMIPVIEYPADTARLGSFEIVLPLLDALDELQSNRLDDVVQFVNSFLAILGGEIDEDTAKKLNEHKMLSLPEGVDAKYLSVAMQQADIQTLKEDLYSSILTICGVPNRNGGTSTSDTGSAVVLRDGWQSAEARAKAVELVFKRSEKQFLKLVLRILRDTVGTSLALTDISIQFTRRNYENIATKSQVLIAMLGCDKIHPELAFASCGIFPDPESAYLQSKAYWEENKKNVDIKSNPMPEV